MTDTPPIVVNDNPAADQIAAGIRQFITVGGPIITVLAATGWGEKIGLSGLWSGFIAASGSIATIAAIIVGQLKTRALSAKASAMAKQLPNAVATTK